MPEEKKKQIRISVRNLVEFLLRSGDLDRRRGGISDKEAMQAGARMHQQIQKKMGASYRAEVPLSYVKEYDNFSLKIEGRADGILEERDTFYIEEIKGIYKELETLEEPVAVHLAQAKCYACMYCLEQGKERADVLMTYCRLEGEKRQEALTKAELRPEVSNTRIRHFSFSYTRQELTVWFEALLQEYYRWAEFQFQWQKKRNDSMRELEFPFAYRPGQRELVRDVYRTILRRKELFVQAPTGIGKTMSTVFPAVRALGEGEGDRIFYLTARTITRTVAQEAFHILQEKGLQIKAVTLTAKEKICACEEPVCTPEACPRAKGHFDRINQAVFEMLTEQEAYSREAIMEQAERWQVCPHELQLDIASWMDAVICDYNYVFDPNVRLKRFFAEGNKGDYLFLIDEAHNLVDRGRDMFSASVVKEEFLEIKRRIRAYDMEHRLEKALERCNRQLLLYKRECDDVQILDGVAGFLLALMNLMGELENFMEHCRQSELAETVLDFYFRMRHFLLIGELLDENYRIYTSYLENGDFQLRLLCVNPASNLQQCMDKGRAAVFFSATLLPVAYYKKMLSTHTDDYAVYVESPFRQENRRLLIGPQVSSRYTRRNASEYEKIAEYLAELVRARTGNYLVFFPSYRLMEEVGRVFEEKIGNEAEIARQSGAMSEAEREAFLGCFQEKRNRTLVGLCVMGGVFSEGIDLDGEKLIGVAVVGTGIPQIGTEREILKKYYDEKGEDGFGYAYRIPGMNKVLQAAGRVIRTTEDKGVILLLDERFLTGVYLGMFPREWADYIICGRGQVAQAAEQFWRLMSRKKTD